jgi:hypothetical protein
MRAHIGEEPRSNHTIDHIKRRDGAQACRGRQDLIAEACIPIQGLKHAIAQESHSWICGIPIKYLLISQSLQHRHLRPPRSFKLAQPGG